MLRFLSVKNTRKDLKKDIQVKPVSILYLRMLQVIPDPPSLISFFMPSQLKGKENKIEEIKDRGCEGGGG